MMNMNLVLAAALLFVSGCGPAANPDAENQAIASASKWLERVDNGSYGESWDHAAAYFKSAVAREAWVKAAGSVRDPLGPLVSRTLKSKSYATSLPGAPDGEYVVIQYDSVFEGKRKAVETVTPMRDEDGSWRVSGYYVN